MILFPAIDLKDGQCVRLLKGDMNKATVFSGNPGGQAEVFAKGGAEWIHIVDLNGAFEGKPVNIEAVRSILRAVKVPVQLGGGIRSLEMIEAWLAEGVSRVILGTVAVRQPELVKEACRKFPGKVAVGIDAKEGKVAVQGWAEASEMGVHDLALKFEDAGVAAIIYTNIEKDGMMQGPDITGTKALAEATRTPVIASGGVSSMADLKALKAIGGSGLLGVICGRAIYDGKVTIPEAVALLR